MQWINGLKNIWIKPVKKSDRWIFSVLILLIGSIYVYTNYIKPGPSFSEHQWIVYIAGALFLAIAFIKPLVHLLLRIWLSISSTIGAIIFLILLFVVYFVIISPIYMIFKLTGKKKKQINSNWTKAVLVNKDYHSMG